jgi:ABC-2 type transport system permease protein
MRKFRASIIKEFLLLLRDKAGIALLFVMPVAMVFIMVIIQDAAINTINDNLMPVIIVDNDRDTLSARIREGIKESGTFYIVDSIDGKIPTPNHAKKLVADGKFQIGLVLPHGASDTLRSNSRTVVKKSFYEIGLLQEFPADTTYDTVNIDIFFDPSLRASSKRAISAMIAEYAVRTEAHMVFRMYSEVLSMMLPEGVQFKSDYPDVIKYRETYATEGFTEIKANSVQHNIPTWTLFAMFFIVIPLGASLIKEKEEGTYMRLISMPGSYSTIFLGRIFMYLCVCILQFFLFLLVGIVLMPLTGMPQLMMCSDLFALALWVLVTAMTAISFGLMIGTVASTNQQAASFGALIVIILAAIGGLFLPTYMMPKGVKPISDISPFSWAHEAFQDLFIRDAGLSTIYPNLVKLLIFALCCFAVAFLYKKWKKVR